MNWTYVLSNEVIGFLTVCFVRFFVARRLCTPWLYSAAVVWNAFRWNETFSLGFIVILNGHSSIQFKFMAISSFYRLVTHFHNVLRLNADFFCNDNKTTFCCDFTSAVAPYDSNNHVKNIQISQIYYYIADRSTQSIRFSVVDKKNFNRSNRICVMCLMHFFRYK